MTPSVDERALSEIVASLRANGDADTLARAVSMANALIGAGRLQEAVQLTTLCTQSKHAGVECWSAHGLALKLSLRFDEAIAAYQRAARLNPQSAVAEHNLAGILGDTERYAESEAAARRAFSKGITAPETWLVLARALVGQAKIDDACAAFRQAIHRRPFYVEALADLATVRWMQTESLNTACQELDAAIAAHPEALLLRVKKAKLFENAGDLDGAIAALAPALAQPGAPSEIHCAAAQLWIYRDPRIALKHAERACAIAPHDSVALASVCVAHLALGRADVAATMASAMVRRAPLDQYALCLLATAWRILGDPRYQSLTDYDNLVKQWPIDIPTGWNSMEAFLADLRERLNTRHPLIGHPVGQSLRHGSQTLQGLDKVDDPVFRAFFEAIEKPIQQHIAHLGQGDDVVRRRATGRTQFNGVWSARLRSGGYHINHVHPRAWLSTACHVAVPDAVGHDKAGWLKFGEPGIPTLPVLPPDHFVKPQPGMLVIFPSYLWHGTVPFTDNAARLSIAFDLLPA